MRDPPFVGRSTPMSTAEKRFGQSPLSSSSQYISISQQQSLYPLHSFSVRTEAHRFPQPIDVSSHCISRTSHTQSRPEASIPRLQFISPRSMAQSIVICRWLIGGFGDMTGSKCPCTAAELLLDEVSAGVLGVTPSWFDGMIGGIPPIIPGIIPSGASNSGASNSPLPGIGIPPGPFGIMGGIPSNPPGPFGIMPSGISNSGASNSTFPGLGIIPGIGTEPPRGGIIPGIGIPSPASNSGISPIPSIMFGIIGIPPMDIPPLDGPPPIMFGIAPPEGPIMFGIIGKHSSCVVQYISKVFQQQPLFEAHCDWSKD